MAIIVQNYSADGSNDTILFGRWRYYNYIIRR